MLSRDIRDRLLAVTTATLEVVALKDLKRYAIDLA